MAACKYYQNLVGGYIKQKQELEHELKNLRRANTDGSPPAFEFMTGPLGGINRLSVQSERAFKLRPNLCHQLYGFEHFWQVRRVLFSAFNLTHEEPTIELIGKKKRLTIIEQALIALMYIESGMSQQQIAEIFGRKHSSMISKVCTLWVPKWGRFGHHLSVLPFIDETTIDEMKPEKFVQLNFDKVAYLIDGKDFKTETVRIDRVVNCGQQSSNHGQKCITKLPINFIICHRC